MQNFILHNENSIDNDDFEDMNLAQNTVADMEMCTILPELGQARNLCNSRDKVPTNTLLMDNHPLLVKWLAGSSQKHDRLTASIGEPYLK